VTDPTDALLEELAARDQDAVRLRYLAENPEVLRYIYSLFGEMRLTAGHDALDAMRDTIDDCIEFDREDARSGDRPQGEAE